MAAWERRSQSGAICNRFTWYVLCLYRVFTEACVRWPTNDTDAAAADDDDADDDCCQIGRYIAHRATL